MVVKSQLQRIKIYVFARGQCGGYAIKQYWPICILIRQDYIVYLVNRVAFNVDNGVIQI